MSADHLPFTGSVVNVQLPQGTFRGQRSHMGRSKLTWQHVRNQQCSGSSEQAYSVSKWSSGGFWCNLHSVKSSYLYSHNHGSLQRNDSHHMKGFHTEFQWKREEQRHGTGEATVGISLSIRISAYYENMIMKIQLFSYIQFWNSDHVFAIVINPAHPIHAFPNWSFFNYY